MTKLIAVAAVALILIGGVAFITERAEAPTDEESSPIHVDTVSTGQQIEIYNGISVDANEYVVDLSGRGLEGSLKAEVRHLKNIEVLDLSNNRFTAFTRF